ncbi:hypothetical protein CPAV1605_131 [seawater metagenome]|uniref:Uncharacterized protein n=1 Tax=seawater metagenome TaxID=1561972 RepID=A0A5E8CIF0_9ZZZZ
MKKNNLLIGTFLIYNLLKTEDNKRYHNKYNYYDNIPCNFPFKAFVDNTASKSSKSKRYTLVTFDRLNKIGYITSHSIQSGANIIIHTLHIVNYDESLYAIYKGTSNNLDPNSVNFWQKSMGEYAPRVINGHLYHRIVFFN